MILTLPVGLQNSSNYNKIHNICALEYRDTIPMLENKMERLFHSGYGIIQEEFLPYFDSIIDYLVENNIKIFSFDLGPSAEKVELEDYYYISKSEPLTTNKLLETIKYRISYIRNKYHGDIALENLNFFPTTAYAHVCETDFIYDAIIENEVDMVLDIAHAIISAKNMGVDKYKYLSLFPLSRVKIIHLSSPGIKDGKWRDLHRIPTNEEYDVLAFIEKLLTQDPYLVIESSDNLATLQKTYESVNIDYNLNKI